MNIAMYIDSDDGAALVTITPTPKGYDIAISGNSDVGMDALNTLDDLLSNGELTAAKIDVDIASL